MIFKNKFYRYGKRNFRTKERKGCCELKFSTAFSIYTHKMYSRKSFRADENTCREIEKDTTTRRWLMAFSLSLRRVLGAHHIYAHRIHPFRKRQGFAKKGALAEKRGFACAFNYQNLFTKILAKRAIIFCE